MLNDGSYIVTFLKTNLLLRSQPTLNL